MKTIFGLSLTMLAAACASRPHTRVPDLLRQGHLPAPQAVTAVDVSADSRFVAVTTLAFRHENNFWVLSDEGKVLWGRSVPPWAPFQVAAPGGADAFAVGLAYSRVTPPHPTIALFQGEKGPETALVDNAGELGFIRYGGGDWRTGWIPSLLGDLLVRAGKSAYTVTSNDGPWRVLDDARRERYTLRHPRPYRLASSADGRRLAFGYIAAETARAPGFVLSVRDIETQKDLWSSGPLRDAAALPTLPDPAADFPDLAADFRLRPDAVVPFRVALSVAIDGDGSRVAATEYGGHLWTRRGPAIGRWDPPYHVIPFLPRQRGHLRVFGGDGQDLARAELPREGLFEVRTDRRGRAFWCFPLSWFARGMAGTAWRPADDAARTIFVHRDSWTTYDFPDAVADLAVHPDGDLALVSCWDGSLYLLRGLDRLRLDIGGPARLAWSPDGRFAVAGTESGEIVALDRDGVPRWRVRLPVAELPPLAQPPKPVFEGLPVYSAGRVGPEHAYVGDIWLVKTAAGGFLVDAGGTSSIPFSLQRIRAAGIDPAHVHHLLHTHSHGDHCGGAYLWRTMGPRIVAPASAAFAMSWVMPMLTDYGVWVPRPVDVPLPLRRAGDETEFEAAGLRIRAIFVPGHSFDSVVYAMELGGKRVVFTGDIGFENQDILHRCWGDAAKAKIVTEIVRTQVLPFKPDFVFTGHGARRDGTAFLEDLVRRSDTSLREAGKPK